MSGVRCKSSSPFPQPTEHTSADKREQPPAGFGPWPCNTIMTIKPDSATYSALWLILLRLHSEMLCIAGMAS